MKLAFIEISGFRGFKNKARFDLPGGFAVLTGRNGAVRAQSWTRWISCLRVRLTSMTSRVRRGAASMIIFGGSERDCQRTNMSL